MHSGDRGSFIVFSLMQPGLEQTIYQHGGEHANHYITDTIQQQL